MVKKWRGGGYFWDIRWVVVWQIYVLWERRVTARQDLSPMTAIRWVEKSLVSQTSDLWANELQHNRHLADLSTDAVLHSSKGDGCCCIAQLTHTLFCCGGCVVCSGTSNSYLHSCIQHSAAVLVIGTIYACLSVFSIQQLWLVIYCACLQLWIVYVRWEWSLLCLVTSARGSGREERHRRCVVLPTTVVCMVMHVMPRG